MNNRSKDLGCHQKTRVQETLKISLPQSGDPSLHIIKVILIRRRTTLGPRSLVIPRSTAKPAHHQSIQERSEEKQHLSSTTKKLQMESPDAEVGTDRISASGTFLGQGLSSGTAKQKCCEGSELANWGCV